MNDLSWLVERPIAHRGLHDAARGVAENSILAARAAIDAGYAIECDVQLSKDGEAVVFHDDRLDRLTVATGPVKEQSVERLAQLRLLGTSETIPTFADFLSVIANRSALVVELKSAFDGDAALARRVAEVVRSYNGRLVIESFDPDPIAFLRAQGEALGVAHVPLGMVGMADYNKNEWPDLSSARRVELQQFLHYSRTRPDFLSWNLADLPHSIPLLAREGLHIPVTTWTVRSTDEAQRARQWSDQIVFEGFRP
jgi:glycerophosphoryl diester phosphodiesterase